MKRLIPVLMVAVLAVAGSVLADTYGTVNVDLTGVAGDIVTVTTPDIGEVYTCPYTYQLSHFLPSGSHPSAVLATGTYKGFCLSLVQDIDETSYTGFSVVDLSDVLSGTALTNALKLFNEYNNMNPTGLLDPQPGALSDALTVALWSEINGPIAVSGLSTGAQLYEGELLAGLASASEYTGPIYALEDGSLQPQEIVLGTSLAIASVPEPMPFVRFASLLLVGLPIGAIALYRRRRQLG